MELQNSKEILHNALVGNYGVGAFNFVNIEMLKAILSSAEENKSPVIIQCSTGAIKYAGAKVLADIAKDYVKDMTVPVCLNLDHGKTFEDCKNAIDAGFTNVMIDASSLPKEENIALTKRVVEYAHARNVTVEAEIGVLAGVEDEISASDEDAKYTNPSEAYEFVNATNVDSLAIAIGTSHGPVKFKGEPHLRFDILEEVSKLLPNFPIVLHGASSIPQDMVKLAIQYGAKLDNAKGVPDELLKKACSMAVCKVNTDSDLRISFTAGIRKYLSENPDTIDLRKYNEEGMQLVKSVVDHKLKNVFMSANKA
ncbi:MAG TPA: fructose-1,6-bisphosphate aldolase, class II [Clostridiales bacterium]|nr:fructose-1,6-bisphosphate aldolase, class II [Clostridiales bacterium]